MPASAADVARLRLVAQRLLGERCASPAQVVAHLLAVQAQDLPGALVSVALRTPDGTTTADVGAALDAGAVVRTWPMRGTLHLVPAEDVGWLTGLLATGPAKGAARRRVALGLTDDHVATAERLVVEALRGRRGLVRAEVLALWEAAGLDVRAGRGYHLLADLSVRRVLVQGPLHGRDQAFVLLDEWVPRRRELDREEAVAEIARRYVVSHGPATERDLARWTGLGLRDVRRGIAAAGDGLTTLEVDGVIHHLDPATPDRLAALHPDGDATDRVLLLPGFDEVVLGYADRSATIPAEHATRVVPGGNGVFRPTVLHGGVAVATWRTVGRGTARRLELEPFTTLAPSVAAAAQDAFERLPV